MSSSPENERDYDSDDYSVEKFRKLFIGGLAFSTDTEQLKEYFSQYGEIVDAVIIRAPDTKKSRGFGFVSYSHIRMVNEVMKKRPHMLDGRRVEVKRAIPKSESDGPAANQQVNRLFVGRLKREVDEEDLREYFKSYGKIENCEIIKYKDSGESRGFGFVTFDDYDPVDLAVLERIHCIKGCKSEVMKALSRDQAPKTKGPEMMERGGGGGGDRRYSDSHSYNSYGGGGGGGGMGMLGSRMGGGGSGGGSNYNSFSSAASSSNYSSYNQRSFDRYRDPPSHHSNAGASSSAYMSSGGGYNHNNSNNSMGGGPSSDWSHSSRMENRHHGHGDGGGGGGGGSGGYDRDYFYPKNQSNYNDGNSMSGNNIGSSNLHDYNRMISSSGGGGGGRGDPELGNYLSVGGGGGGGPIRSGGGGNNFSSSFSTSNQRYSDDSRFMAGSGNNMGGEGRSGGGNYFGNYDARDNAPLSGGNFARKNRYNPYEIPHDHHGGNGHSYN